MFRMRFDLLTCPQKAKDSHRFPKDIEVGENEFQKGVINESTTAFMWCITRIKATLWRNRLFGLGR